MDGLENPAYPFLIIPKTAWFGPKGTFGWGWTTLGVRMSVVDAFSHLTILVTNLDRSEKFYRDVFGLDLIGRNLVNESSPNSLLGTNTRQRVVLLEVPEVQAIRPNSNTIHHAWYLTPEQFARAQVRLQAAGFDITDSRQQFRAMGENNMDVIDPDGHWFQVQSYGPEAKQVLIEDIESVDCGNVADYPLGSVQTFMKGKFFLVHNADGFVAFSRWCTHMNGLLTWKKEHWHFYCPMHNATYNRKGNCVSFGHKMPPLRRHPVSIGDDGSIVVHPNRILEMSA
jgi:Rieske Fe-S protein